jgi:hypothetical protein
MTHDKYMLSDQCDHPGMVEQTYLIVAVSPDTLL